jgi:predicted ATPase
MGQVGPDRDLGLHWLALAQTTEATPLWRALDLLRMFPGAVMSGVSRVKNALALASSLPTLERWRYRSTYQFIRKVRQLPTSGP